MATTWFMVELESGKIMLAEINPKRGDGTLKRFVLDGEGYLWMPYLNPSAEGGRQPERLGKLLTVSQGEPPEVLFERFTTGKEVVIVPVS